MLTPQQAPAARVRPAPKGIRFVVGRGPCDDDVMMVVMMVVVVVLFVMIATVSCCRLGVLFGPRWDSWAVSVF